MNAGNHPLTLPAEGYARLPTVMHVVGLRHSQIYERMAAGRFPRPVKYGRTSLWPVDEIRVWLADPAGWRAEPQTA